jgi:PBSX family phage terminase large subunit
VSTPLFQEFNPKNILWQWQAVQHFNQFDYTKGILEVLFSGSVGSAKSIEAAHIIVKHCLKNTGARILVLRKVLKDLKRTLWGTLLAHMADIPHMISSYNKTEMKITFVNGSEIIGDSYDKMDLEKFRSLELSGVAYEEASESNKLVYDAVKMRVGRLPSVKENFILTLTNPDEPSHYLYKEMIQKDGVGNRKVFYSLTEQNPFLPSWYIENLRADLDPMMVRRMLRGEWISIQGKTPYYAYDSTKQFKNTEKYKINPNYPLDIFHDFNIGEGKPMSAGCGQVIKDKKGNAVFHIAKNYIVEGFNTEEILDEMIDSGIFETVTTVRIFGDRNGKNNDTRGNKTDYDIIKSKLQKYVKENGGRLNVVMQVPNINPPIRSRQNIVNAHCLNDLGDIRMYVYQEAETVDEGLKLTKLKKGSTYQEDDSDPFQHVVTAVGYYIHHYKNSTEKIGSLRPSTGRR